MKDLALLSSMLRIKECDLRLDALFQCATSIDHGIHVGGAFSAFTSMTALYYGGLMNYNVEDPTDTKQDMFILSKGHAVAALAAIYADVGYFDKKYLENSRGYGAMIKGHPGPIIPGVPVATGPLGHGVSISCGYAMRRQEHGTGNVYCLVGDGELQEGSNWEGILLAADKKLSNLCVIVDVNNGQSDNTKKLVVSLDDVAAKFKGFGYRVLETNADEIESVLLVLETFVAKPQGTAPTAIICHSRKGFGGHTAITGLHKAQMDDAQVDLEKSWQEKKRAELVDALNAYASADVDSVAAKLGYTIVKDAQGKIVGCKRNDIAAKCKRAEPRDKKLKFNEAHFPVLDRNKKYNTFGIAKQTMQAFAEDSRLYTIDSDLSNASGLFDGAVIVNSSHAINVGIAECNMMCVAEALASEGANVWTSTFSPFFDQRALRRIAVSYQERVEAIEAENGWLSEGHNLDITFMATSANLETAVNGATHMGNDDITIANQMAHVKVIDVGCPQMLLSVMRWISEGNKGLVYLRTMKTNVCPIYPENFEFTYGTAYTLRDAEKPSAVLVSSGHGIFEALQAADILQKKGIEVRVVDMPSFDVDFCKELAAMDIPVVFAEQNNGAWAEKFAVTMMQNKVSYDPNRIHSLNVRDSQGQLQYIQSGTYSQLLEAMNLTPEAIAQCVMQAIN